MRGPEIDPEPSAIDPPPGVRFPAFDAAAIARIAREVDATGVCRLEGAVPDAWIAEARRHAEAAVARNGGEYVARDGRIPGAGHLLSDIHADPAFAGMLRGLHRAATGQAPASGHVHQVLRCLKGRTARHHANYLHYDSFAVTILIPLAVPARGAAGDLILLPNRRPFRRSYALNAIEKALHDRAIVQRLLWRRIRAGRAAAVRLAMTPGSVYIFWGYRSLHANAASDPAGLRATLLYHFGNPHERSRLRRWLTRR
ncbi:hypothetical protein [Sphingomonas profundi]|uniref:hypothetical protein n=1 Tax=Alterirhizorhabdus profundi TaxID=2681549 RepID=UPI0012E76669|nr:hypothetical protein [Sphingomonas profundi]